MMGSSYFSTSTKEEAFSSHLLERELFTRLVYGIGTNPNLAMEIIAFWMWLEEVGHPLIILPLLELPDVSLQSIAVEAKKCLTSLPNPPMFAAGDSPVNLHFVHSHREVVLLGVTTILNKVCTTIFSDITKLLAERRKRSSSSSSSKFRVFGEGSSRMGEMGINHVYAHRLRLHPNRREEEQLLKRNTQQLRFLKLDNSNITTPPRLNSVHLLHSPDQSPRDNSILTPTVMAQTIYRNMVSEIRRSNVVINTDDRLMQSWCPPQRDVPRDERTLFVTFSNGYPLEEDDLRDFFARNFGPIETIYTQQSPPGEEPLFARIVFNLQETILLILNGNERVKFRIKGKHVWARRYVPKKKKATSFEKSM